MKRGGGGGGVAPKTLGGGPTNTLREESAQGLRNISKISEELRYNGLSFETRRIHHDGRWCILHVRRINVSERIDATPRKRRGITEKQIHEVSSKRCWRRDQMLDGLKKNQDCLRE